jgi:urocanate reductase
MGRFNPGVYHGTASGNAPDNKLSKIEVAVTLSEDRIEKVEIVSHGEVKGVGYGIPTAPVEALPGLIVKYQSLGVQPIVGAEKSSKAILKAVTAAVAASGANTAALSKPVAPEAFADEERKVGLLVLGGGVGGLAAAVEAKRAGLDVLVIEKAGVTGGSAARSGGKLMAAGTKWQEKQGIYDSPDMLYTYMLEQSRGRADKQKLRFFCDHAYENILWLEGMGYHVQDVECIHESLFPWRVYNSPGGHYMSNGQGGEITTALHHEYERLGGEMIFNCGLESLVRENGRVVGAVCAHTGGGKLTVRADNVILATGGEAQNREYCEKKYGLKGYYTNVPKTNDGTGTRAALAVGRQGIRGRRHSGELLRPHQRHRHLRGGWPHRHPGGTPGLQRVDIPVRGGRRAARRGLPGGLVHNQRQGAVSRGKGGFRPGPHQGHAGLFCRLH